MAFVLFRVPNRRQRNVKYTRINPRHTLSRNQSLIRQRYRFTDEQLDWLTDLLSPMLGDDIRVPWAISKRLQVMMGLRYLCTNSHENVVGDTLGCSQKTVSNIVHRVVDALSHPSVVHRFIKIKPHDHDWCRRRASEFGRLGKFSNVIGLIDGTLVPILTPKEDGFQYVSRKGFSCLNVCVVCDAVGRILYVNCGFPGLVHDSIVWKKSMPGRLFENGGSIQGYCLLGDSGYANGQGIMTPYRPSSVREDYRKRRYNREHCRIRCHVEMTISRWKARFPILRTKLRVSPEFAVKVILACAVLHNIGYCLGAWSGRRLGRTRSTIPHPPASERDLRKYMMENI